MPQFVFEARNAQTEVAPLETVVLRVSVCAAPVSNISMARLFWKF